MQAKPWPGKALAAKKETNALLPLGKTKTKQSKTNKKKKTKKPLLK